MNFAALFEKHGTFISFSRNQHQKWSQLFFRFLLAKESIVHRHMDHSLQIILSIRSPVRWIHTTSHFTELAPCSVGSMCGHVLSVFAFSRLSWIANVSHCRTPVVKSGLSVLHVLVIRLTVQLNVIHITFRTQRTVAHELAFTTLIMWWSYGFVARLDLSYTLTFPAIKKKGVLQSNVTCFHCSLTSAT